MHSSWKDSRNQKWAGLLGGLVLAACGAPDLASQGAVGEPTDSLGTAQAKLDATLNSTLKTVMCGDLTANCDSATELWGRGQVIYEHYYPSTLGGTCPDGNLGTSSDSEWVQRVRLFTSDQKPLTQGRLANIEVTVQMPTQPQNNFVDLYYTTNVNTPSWTLITTLTPTGTGQQTLTASYTLPTGSQVQAVRAAMRRGGTASPCTTGGYDDRDDLAFTAAAPYVSGAKATSVSSGFQHSLALREDGTLWGWGDNYYSELGSGFTQYNSTLPVQATLLSGVKAVYALNDSSLALRTDGTVWAWGGNGYGVFGNGTTTPSSTPVQVSGLTGVTALAAGHHHVLALKSDGTVWAWGENSYAQLGDGTTTNRTVPVRVGTLSAVTAISAGWMHSLALKSDGTVWAWGDNSGGSLGDGTTTGRLSPVKVSSLTGVSSIAAGNHYSLAIRNSRELWAWGVGPLGDTVNMHQSPTRTYLWSTGTFSVFAGASHAVALERTLGKAWTWGDISSGQSCTAPSVNYGSVPAVLSNLSGVAGVSVGDAYAQVFLTDGTVWGWGSNGYLQDGNDQVSSGCVPVKVLLP